MRISRLLIVASLLLAIPGSSLAAARWTFMVYMCADNSMNDQSYTDLAEMSQALHNPEVNVLVQVDRAASDSLPFPVRYLVTQGHLEFLGQMPELDMADPQNLIDFARFAREQYPADNYFLTLWDHGNGWPAAGPNRKASHRRLTGASAAAGSEVPDSLSLKATSIIYDASSGNWMGVADGSLRRALDGARSVLGRKVAILALDACLMQMIEVAGEVANAAQFMAGTEDLMPFNGLPYDTVITLLGRRPDLTPRAVAELLPEAVVQSYSDGSQGREDVTFSVIDLSRYGAAVQELTEWLRVVSAHGGDERFHLARKAAQTFACEHTPPAPTDDYLDLIDLLEKSPSDFPDAPAHAASAIAGLRRSVVACATNCTTLAGAQGIAVWFPDNYLALKRRHAEYADLQFSQGVPWLSFLNCFFHADDVRPSPVTLQADHSEGSIRLSWDPASDLSPVTYQVNELIGDRVAFSDPIENLANWLSDGFDLVSYEGRSALFTGSGTNLDHRLTLRLPLDLQQGLLSLAARVNTYEGVDTAGRFFRDICYVELSSDTLDWTRIDSLYGPGDTWVNCRYLFDAGHSAASSRTTGRRTPNGSVYLRFRYCTGAWPHVSGVYLDSITVRAVDDLRLVRGDLSGCAVQLHAEGYGGHSYVVTPRDSFGNTGYVSNPAALNLTKYAEPYSMPAPLRASVDGRPTGGGVIVCDYPAGQTPNVAILTLSGELVRSVPTHGKHSVPWDLKNTAGIPVASGVYIVAVRGQNFSSLGRIAVVR